MARIKGNSIAVLSGYAAFVALVFWACGQHSPAGPSGPSFGTSGPVGPIGPSSIPIGPSGVPIGPSGRPIGPSGLPAPGGGGTGATPTPTPGGGGVSPTPGCAIQSTSLTSIDTPVTFGGSGGPLSSNIPRPTGLENCKIKTMTVSFHATAATSNDLTQASRFGFRPVVGMVNASGVGAAASADLFTIQPETVSGAGPRLQGTQLGTSCAPIDMTFVETGTPFDPTAAPYSGIWELSGLIPATSSFASFVGKSPSTGEWEFSLDFTDDLSTPAVERVILECWRVDLTLE